MKAERLQIGKRVRLNFYPYCEGTITEIEEEYPENRAKVRWDDEKLGTSGWLSAYELIDLS